MKQAFIIMQIGNPGLDEVCREAIVPALRSCNLDPKRVDKHNEGRLLKSEIVKFIESSDIIIADLTNERPNCYLEVGYAMGLGKFKNLILTAREDHSQDSPNYRKGRPKIHFDLSGYDILFWDSNNLEKFKEELEKRIKRRLEIIEAQIPTSISSWDKEWVSKHRETALSGLKKCDISSFMEIRMNLPDLKLDATQKELLEAAERAQINTFGWPIGIVFDRGENRPKPTADGIVAEVIFEDNKSYLYDYWCIRKDGAYYLLKSLFEGKVKPGHIFFNTRIIRITEALLYSARLYSNLGVSEDSRVLIEIRHGGLKDCVLSAAGTHRFLFPFHERKSREDKVYTEVDTTFEKIESNLVDLVQEFTRPLLVIFDFFEVERNVLEDIVNNYVAGRVA